ncbi:alpha/beta hydrolase [Nakamurella alba]|uniref:alpha/beta hydrolase n=1 Tax=Nakamurella alba TaxID=2665158 RepID=UPI002AC35FC5|nr:alpha/beta fold hydrolase [Nakamurella alba]
MLPVLRSPDGAALLRWAPRRPGPPRVRVLVLHGGNEISESPTRWTDPAVLRMWLIARMLHRRIPDAAVALLRDRIRGWNDSGVEAVDDARWAADVLTGEDADVPVVLVGHSMGGRVAVRVAGDPGIRGAVLLAPWLPDDEPVDTALRARVLVAVQGSADRTCSEESTRSWFSRAGLEGITPIRVLLPGAGHAMVRSLRRWDRLTRRGVEAVLRTPARP